MALQALPSSIDFGHYRETLKNTAVVDEMEKALKEFQVKKVDVSRQIKALEGFEVQAVKSAEETKRVVDEEVGGLRKCLADIESVRGWEEITVVSINFLVLGKSRR